MTDKSTLNITIGSETFSCSRGTTLETIAAAYQREFDDDILLAMCDGKLRELHKTVERDCSVRFLTARDKPGFQTYERSMILLFMKAFHDVVGAERIERLRVECSVSRALLIRCAGDFTLDEALLGAVRDRMRALVDAALPIVKHDMDTDEAIALFRASGMEDKAQTLRWRIGSHVNVYELDGYFDYFYGYMVPNTRYLRYFDILPGEADYLYLLLPDQADPKHAGPFEPSEKVAQTLYEAALRAEELGVANVGALNAWIAQDRARELILAQEAFMEKRIGDIAQEIVARRDVRFVMIAGPSSSGKTTFSHRLSTQLLACGLRPHAIATDNYFKNRDETPRDENGEYDFECLEAMDVEGFNSDMLRLLAGETVELPTYNFKKGAREYNGDRLTLGENDVLVIEGIHCLNDRFTHALPAERKFKIYISCLTTLNIDDHNRIPTTDARLLRRIERDARTRGYSAEATIRMWPSVRRGEESHIFPFQDSADVVFNSALTYEMSLLRPYIEPILFDVPVASDAYAEARRLLKFLNYFLPVPADLVPATSIAREFIGGGIYHA